MAQYDHSPTHGSRRSGAGAVVAALALAVVGFSVLHQGAGAAHDPEQARLVIGDDAARMTGPGKVRVEAWDATH